MERRRFPADVRAAGRRAPAARALRAARGRDAPPRYYARTRLVDIHGAPIRARALAAGDELRVPVSVRRRRRASCSSWPRRPRPAPTLRREDGATYAWQGGVGPRAQRRRVLGDLRAQARVSDARGLVHPLPARPLGDVGRRTSSIAAPTTASTIPRQGARVVAGPGAAAARRDPARARSPRATSCSRSARSAPSSSTRSSTSTRCKLALEYGGKARARRSTDDRVVRELENYCKTTIQC